MSIQLTLLVEILDLREHKRLLYCQRTFIASSCGEYYSVNLHFLLKMEIKFLALRLDSPLLLKVFLTCNATILLFCFVVAVTQEDIFFIYEGNLRLCCHKNLSLVVVGSSGVNNFEAILHFFCWSNGCHVMYFKSNFESFQSPFLY
jgi:hypothetical protein